MVDILSILRELGSRAQCGITSLKFEITFGVMLSNDVGQTLGRQNLKQKRL